MPRAPYRRVIAEDIIARIKSGEYQPKQRLPRQRELAAAYGCSMEPVKRAVEDLERDGWVVTRQGLGMFVADEPPV